MYSQLIRKVVSAILCICMMLSCVIGGALADDNKLNRVSDNEAPAVTHFSFAENGATLTPGQVLHFSVQVEDRSRIDRVGLYLQTEEETSDNVGETWISVEPIEYNPATDLYEGQYTIPNTLSNATWYLNSVYAYDTYGNYYGLGGTDHGTFTVTGSTGTATGNLFQSMTIAENGQTVKPGDSIHLTVKLSGQADYMDAYMCVDSPDGYTGGRWIGFQYNEEKDQWELEYFFNESMLNGRYYIQYVEYHINGQSNWIQTYSDVFGDLSVTLTGAKDFIANPVITSIVFAENNMTLGPGDVLHLTATIENSDDVDYAYAYFDGPHTSSTDGITKWTDEVRDAYRKNNYSQRTGGNIYVDLHHESGNIWTGTYTLPDDLPNTTYSLSDAYASTSYGGGYGYYPEPNTCAFIFNGPDIVSRGIENFVKRCYRILLGRDVDETGLQGWGLALASGQSTASEIINSITTSEEFRAKKYSDEKKVEMMYQVMLDRDADESGKAGWVQALEQGYSLSAIVNGFCTSVEFRGVCKDYGIRPGTVDPGPVPTPGKDMKKIKAFVSRCYQIILNREADEGGLNGWAAALADGSAQASQIIDGFVQSAEFTSRNFSSAQSVDILYKAMLGREADEGGKAGWVDALSKGYTLRHIINGFCGSPEFTNICSEYGITPGSVAVAGTMVRREAIAPEGEEEAAVAVFSSEFINEEKIRAFVEHCYEAVFGREGDAEGIANYTKLIMDGKKTPKKVAYEFIFSPEFQNQLPGNEAFIRILYKLYFDRVPGAEELAGWVAMLESGASLEEIVNGFATSAEFKAIINTMK